jgi:hypothetical protein
LATLARVARPLARARNTEIMRMALQSGSEAYGADAALRSVPEQGAAF